MSDWCILLGVTAELRSELECSRSAPFSAAAKLGWARLHLHQKPLARSAGFSPDFSPTHDAIRVSEVVGVIHPVGMFRGLASEVSACLRSSQHQLSRLWGKRPTAVFFVFVPVRTKLAADLSLKVSYWLPWSLARSLNETGFRAVLNYAARIGSDGTVPCSGLKSGQKRQSGGLSERLSNPSVGPATEEPPLL